MEMVVRLGEAGSTERDQPISVVPEASRVADTRVSCRRPSVLHITEALGGGIASSILAMVESTPEFDHHLLSTKREQHDIGTDLNGAFASCTPMPPQLRGARRAVVSAYDTVHPDVVHIHSSIAGAISRSTRISSDRVVYSPHCFAFEREDLSALKRRAVRLIERCLARRTAVLAAVSPHEIELGRGVGYRRTRYIPNRTDTLPRLASYNSEPAIVTVGRISPQKDLDYFLQMVSGAQRSEPSSVVWLGGGPVADEMRLRAAGILVTGWISRLTLISRLSDAQVYVHSAAWEGAPISILEAAACGLPLVLRRIDSIASLNPPGLCESATEADQRVRLLRNPLEWQRAQRESLAFAARFSRDTQAAHLRELYRDVGAIPA